MLLDNVSQVNQIPSWRIKAGTGTQIDGYKTGASTFVYDHGGQELGRGVNIDDEMIYQSDKIPKDNVTARNR